MMRKPLFFLVVSISLLSSCAIKGLSKPNSDNQQLPFFIIGKWTAVVQISDENGSYEKEYFVEFVDNKTVTLLVRAPVGGINSRFDYSFVDDNTLLVENERAKDGKWFVNQVENDLILCIWSQQNCIEFQRVN